MEYLDSSTIPNIIKELTYYFQEYNVSYVIIGGFSVLTWGRIRTTEGIDIIVDHTVLNLNDFVNYLKRKNYFVELDDFIGFKEGGHCTLVKKESLFRIDIIGKYSIDQEISLQEAKEIEFQDIKLRMDSPENLIAHKLKFGADFDIEDAIAVIVRLNERINIQKLLIHVTRLGVKKELVNLLKRIRDQKTVSLLPELLDLPN